MADASGLRQRKKGGASGAGASPDAGARPAEEVDQDQEHDDTYGYDGSDAEDDQDVRTQPAPARADDDGSSSEEQYDDDDDDEEAEDIYANARPAPAYLLDEPQPTDTYILLAGFAGFILSLFCAALLPSFGIAQDHVMAAGMLSLLFFVMWMSFCPSFRKKKLNEPPAGALSPIEQISPGPVFIVTACIGTMIGGLIGGGVQHAWPALHR